MITHAGPRVIILAAGKGVRMASRLPKVLHKICGRSLIARALAPVAALTPSRVVVVLGQQADLVQAEIDRLRSSGVLPSALEVVTVLQKEQLGTGHAVMAAEEALGEGSDAEVFILPGDAPLLQEEDLEYFLSEHRRSKSKLSVITAMVEDAAGFGRILRDSAGNVQRIVERKDCSPDEIPIREMNSSLYVAELGFLREALRSLTSNNAQGEYYLTDIVEFAVSKGLAVNGIRVGDATHVLGANDRAELSVLEAMRRREINTALMKAGVSLEDPLATYVDEGITVGRDSFLGAGTRLRGKTRIGSDVVIEGGSLLLDAEIADGCLIKLNCHIEGAVVGAGSFVGPFARLRQGTVLHENVHVGNFVEAKNTELHADAKANHVSYLGDSSIGSFANIGAGTIFCNYDGQKKWKTGIGHHVFVGSNSTLVAPVNIEPNSYIGAGSVITENVPEEALALGRARQTVKLGWAKGRKEKK